MPQRSLTHSFLEWRNKLVASDWFQSWAVKFPLTRPIARRKARALFDICAGFVYSQTLFAAVELDLFERLRAGPRTLADLARETGMPSDGLERLLKAGASLDLFSNRGDSHFALGELGAALLGNASVADMVKHHKYLYADLQDPLGLLRERCTDTQLASFWGYADDDTRQDIAEDEARLYSNLMASTQAFIAREVLETYDFSGHESILDIGGGMGAFLTAVLQKHETLQGRLFDLPAVAGLAGEALGAAGLAARSNAVGGDFFRDEFPQGADIITLVRVLHDHDDANVDMILSKARRAIKPGGHLLIAEPLAGTKGAEPMGDAYFGIYLWAMGSGRPRTFNELKGMLAKAGFGSARLVPTQRPILTQVILAQE